MDEIEQTLPYSYSFDNTQQNLLIHQEIKYNQTWVIAILPIPCQELPYPGYEKTFEKPQNKDALERVKRLVHMANCAELTQRYLDSGY